MTAPLSGLKVIDLSRVLGGPYAAQILADHGANVIKIEPPAGDETRSWGPPFETDVQGDVIGSAYFAGTNRGKRGLSLDLGHAEARRVLKRLLQSADILIENFRRGAMARWGLDYERDLKPHFPRLIYARVSGFGDDGPLGGAPGYDAIAQAMSGLMSINGTPDTGPLRIGVPIVDMAAGMNAVMGILMALNARERTGEGSFVEATLFDAGLALLHPHSANWLMGGVKAAPQGSAHPNIAPYDLFQTATGPIFLAIGNDRQFAKALEILGATHIAADPRFATNGARNTNRTALRAALETLLSGREAASLARELIAAGVPAGEVASVDAALASPQVRHRAMVTEADGYRGVASPIRVGADRQEAVRRPPRFAEHTGEILAEAGYTEDEIAALTQSGAVIVEQR
jgi:crotonobetainyl-CoA:carnitine CoA-transferase CaiB-like acyl-CoA transferase